ncbi:hypothetical protein QAD02_011903 [Eretmocerus hayati]|uniref:Uncharacterized protein n=1 Tax=Eretmocerus hayati TaxID=131215 RepID=A0ACC2NYC0_9HYME|nr:hypothetical protein QAD02_011903 [Eretmocerus hayati]
MGNAKKLLKFVREITESGVPDKPSENTEAKTLTSEPNESCPMKRSLHQSPLSPISTKDASPAKIPKQSKKSPKNVTEHSNQPSCSKSVSPENNKTDGAFLRFDTLRETILDHRQGDEVIEALDSDELFLDEKRTLMVRIICAELVLVRGNYPKHEFKGALTEALTTEFPRLKNEFSAFGFEHYYHPELRVGYIQTRLRNYQRSLPMSQRRYNTRPNTTKNILDTKSSAKNGKTTTLLSEEELEEKISRMLGLDETEGNEADINDLLSETFYNRQNWILKDSPSVTAVLKKYPRLKGFDGYMLDQEFGRMFEGKNNAFITEFPSSFEKRLIYSAKFYNPKLFEKYRPEKNESLKALLILIGLVPQPASVVLSRSKKTASEGQIKSKKVPKLRVKKTEMKTYPRKRINMRRENSNNKQAPRKIFS